MSQTIITVPHEVLRAQSTPIRDFYSPELATQLQTMIDSLFTSPIQGVGLSFPQIGLNLRGFITHLEGRLKVYLNPEILDVDEQLTLGGRDPKRPTLEGCLSIPHIWGPVNRPKKIKVKAFDQNGVEFTRTLSSFPAKLFQHEYDHLEGVLFTDYTLRDDLPLYLYDKQTDQFTKFEDPAAIIKW